MIDWYFGAPRRAFGLICLACVLMLAFGLYLQHVVGLEPCPMCIVQRYALVLVALFTGLAGAFRNVGLRVVGGVLALLAALGGAYTAASQSWLQWYPPEVVSCGRDLYGMIETFPLKRALPMIFRGGGDCSKIDWSLFGLTLANWSFIAFVVLSLLLITLLLRSRRAR
ncbi:disulfide bond formation protein B [Variovorax sp. NFACC27]|uniref:Disulfide bond formation protein B n=1 Tax=Variovorax gossypii TaxID=1679495 RepID=A0A431TRR2_9BURK|nr:MULTISPECIES: disulfide bond formation protein B [Variovorax]MDP9600759.1 disulfide bond formation protein DsbB [Variovorax paradoxus]SEF27817.1 disulfide bond formation protein DsbB [Variovorax sp. NFACC28]SEG71819.1 disulfide bond formation protein DsbB [Variovorax sp. NFACC29]SFC79560.1 disulfide bond formation protein DsbB [Variovorax sp. NFACC26]SFF99732.1 disulfide bond formation protein DsbB [Variovorax sp. NFACC27]